MTDATWKDTPFDSHWSDPGNWQGGATPDGTAHFSNSAETALTFLTQTYSRIGSITFAEGAPPFSFTVTELGPQPALTIDGDGVTNNALAMQSFVVASYGTYGQPQLSFAGQAGAGDDTVLYYAGPVSLETGYGGGTIAFSEAAHAGSARFTVRTGKASPKGQVPPGQKAPFDSTLGGSVVFTDKARAGEAVFSLFGTLGDDGDTFGNVVFHNSTTAERATFLNYGGTVPGGDGGNTQFYDSASAATGVYINRGGTAYKHEKWGGANGGDVAFDGNATGGRGWFLNFPASIAGANGGVTSFNNNPNFPHMDKAGASAGDGTYINYGGTSEFPGGGGHTELTARYGFSTAGRGTFVNMGSTQESASTAGHTIFAIDPPNQYNPSAENGVFWNHPGVSGGYTEFLSYGSDDSPQQPDAAQGVFHNLGSADPAEQGGYTAIRNGATAGQAVLIAYGGVRGGQGGRVVFSDKATGGTAQVRLIGNGTLDLTARPGTTTIGQLSLMQGVIALPVGAQGATLDITQGIEWIGGPTTLALSVPQNGGVAPNTPYLLLQAPNLSAVGVNAFAVDARIGTSQLSVSGTGLYVTFTQIAGAS